MVLPFGLPGNLLRLYGYWHTILPGSKRLVTPSGDLVGDNTDVRPPAPDEMWTGGGAGGIGGGSSREQRSAVRATLTLDGVFFADGSFAGPDRHGLWEMVVCSAEAYRETAQLARRLHDQGTAAAQILSAARNGLGAAGFGRPPRPGWSPDDYRRWTRGIVASRVESSQRNPGDDRALCALLDWLEAPAPAYRRL